MCKYYHNDLITILSTAILGIGSVFQIYVYLFYLPVDAYLVCAFGLLCCYISIDAVICSGFFYTRTYYIFGYCFFSTGLGYLLYTLFSSWPELKHPIILIQIMQYVQQFLQKYIKMFWLAVSYLTFMAFVGLNHLQACLHKCLFSLFFAYVLILICRCKFSQDFPLERLRHQSIALNEISLKCTKCDIKKPGRLSHCRRCNRCIFRMDHHCQWIDNCVAAFNLKLFVQFLFATFLYIIVIEYLLMTNIPHIIANQIGIAKLVLGSLISIENVFVLQQLARLLHQIYLTIAENQTLVETYKYKRGLPTSFLYHFTQFFTTNPLHWILPTRPRFQANLLENVYDAQLSDKQIAELHYKDAKEEQCYKYRF